MNGKTLLLHVCCAPCASGCVDLLRQSEKEFEFYFSNSNIMTLEEYEKRLDSVEKLAKIYRLNLTVDPYDHDAWLSHVSKLKNYDRYPETGPRCTECFFWSLKRTADAAEEKGMNFATTLTVSPHKRSAVIFEIGNQYSHFEAWDFKKKDGFKKSIEASRRLELYRQTFCGCEFASFPEKNPLSE